MEYQAKYWRGKGKYQKLYSRLYEKLVPAEDDAKTNHGQILRFASKWYYDIFNNGGCNHDVLSDYLQELLVRVPAEAKKATRQFIKKPKKDLTPQYELFLDLYIDWVVRYAAACEALEKI